MVRFRSGLPFAEGSKRWFWCLTITVAYVITGRLALLLAVPPGYATAIFPPAGIAMAAVLIGGWSVLPCVFIGSLVLNLWAGISVAALSTSSVIAVATVIAAASVAQAALGAWSLRRVVGYPLGLDNAFRPGQVSFDSARSVYNQRHAVPQAVWQR